MNQMNEIENSSQILADGSRRQKFTKSGGGALTSAGVPTKYQADTANSNQTNPFYITSPLNKSKQEVFSQTGKLNLQGDMGSIVDETR